MKKLLLISPSSKTRKEGSGQRAWQATPPLALGYLAALTPPDWQVTIIDEYLEPIDMEQPADLVGITALTCNAPRAYEIASQFRSRGVPVVMGGIHASLRPEEAGNFVDAVVIGEAEPVWSSVLADFEGSSLRQTYVEPKIPLADLPIPRRDLFSHRYEIDLVLTSKGCPFNCSFCNVTVFNGSQYRRRPIEQVLEELKTIDKKIIYFVDDNLFGSDQEGKERILRLFTGMISGKFGKIWGAQASLNIADDPEVLRYAYKSGCRSLFIGIESIHDASLREMNKSVNLKRGRDGMRRAIERIHHSGIGVCTGFIFGNDHDDSGVFRETLEFVRETGVDVVAVSFLTPFPGTKLFERLITEKRLLYDQFPQDWDLYDQNHIVFKPNNCDLSGLVRAVDRIDDHRGRSKPRILRKALGTFLRTRNLNSARFAYYLNAGAAAQ